jgi:hypothetical protein
MFLRISCKFGKLRKEVLENHKIKQAKKFKDKSAHVQKAGSLVLITDLHLCLDKTYSREIVPLTYCFSYGTFCLGGTS